MIARIAAVAAAVGALAIMIAPTWRVPETGPDGLEAVGRAREYTLEPWSSATLFGYGDVFPLLAMVLTLFALIAGAVSLRSGGRMRTMGVLTSLSAVSTLLGGLLFEGLAPGPLSAIALLLASSLLALTLGSRSHGATEPTTTAPAPSPAAPAVPVTPAVPAARPSEAAGESCPAARSGRPLRG